MVYGPIAIPLTSTRPMEALRILDIGVFRISRLRASMRNPCTKRKIPAHAPIAAGIQKLSVLYANNAKSKSMQWVRALVVEDTEGVGPSVAESDGQSQQKTAVLAYVGNARR